MSEPHVVVLGGGPAGVGAAYKLREQGKARVTLVEQREWLGGNAGSFEHEGVHLDFGSHRLHPGIDPRILADIRALLGDDLRERERNGRIRLRGGFLRFPLRVSDLLLRLDKRLSLAATRDMALRAWSKVRAEDDSCAQVLYERFGPTLCEHVYFPYARKVWGCSPSELSAEQASFPLAARSLGELIGRAGWVGKRDRFLYPREGYGQISRAYGQAAEELGAELRLGSRVVRIELGPNAEGPCTIELEQGGQRERLQADHVLSTLPLPLLARLCEPQAPPEVVAASRELDFRALVLVYLELEVDRFSAVDAYYFPEENVRMTRLSEPKNYAGASEPEGRTVLCAELPCSPDDDLWEMDDAALGRLISAELERVELPLPRAPRGVFTRRLRRAYPIHTRGYEQAFRVLDAWTGSLAALTTYGRQGLFAHDDGHHALRMAYCAAECFEQGRFDAEAWRAHRERFSAHAVEN